MVEELINGTPIHTQIFEDVTYGTIDVNQDYIWSFLLFTGYLKIISCETVGDETYYDMVIPNVEIKSSVYYYEELEKKTMELIERFGLKERIIISSFNHLSALSCKDFMSDIKTGALVGNGGIANAGYYCKKFGFECYHPGIEGLTKEEVELCHKNGIEVNVWTINNMDDLENMYEWGCDGVITNCPDVCKSWLEAKKAKC